MTPRILVVDDDPALAEMIGIVLRADGFEPRFCADGSGGARRLPRDQARPGPARPDAARASTASRSAAASVPRAASPIIMLTAKGDTVRRRRAGSRAAPTTTSSSRSTRKSSSPASAPGCARPPSRQRCCTVGDLTSTSPRTRCAAATPSSRSPRSSSTCCSPSPSKPQQVFTREMLLEQVWGYHYKADTRLVNVHVQRLRAKVEHDPDDPRIVTTVRGVGYRAGASLSPVPPTTVGLVGPGRVRRRLRRWRRRGWRAVRVPVAVVADVPHRRDHRRPDRARRHRHRHAVISSIIEQRLRPAARPDRGRVRTGHATRAEHLRLRDRDRGHQPGRARHAAERGAARDPVDTTSPGGTSIAILRTPGQTTPQTIQNIASHDFPDAVITDALREAVGKDTGRLHLQAVAPRRRRPTGPGIAVGSTLQVPTRRPVRAVPRLRPERRAEHPRLRAADARHRLLALVAAHRRRSRRSSCGSWSGPSAAPPRRARRSRPGISKSASRSTGRTSSRPSARSFNGMADAMQRQITQLAELSRVQQRFVSDVSHELRTPLTTIRLAGDVLYDQRDAVRRRRPRARPSSCTRRSTASSCCSPTCSRSRASTPGASSSRPSRSASCGSSRTSSTSSARSPTRPGSSSLVDAGRLLRRRDRRRAASAASCATCSATPSSTARAGPIEVDRRQRRQAVAIAVRDHGVGMPPEDADPRLRPVLAGRPVAQAHHRRHRARPRDQPGGRRAPRRPPRGLVPARRGVGVRGHRCRGRGRSRRPRPRSGCPNSTSRDDGPTSEDAAPDDPRAASRTAPARSPSCSPPGRSSRVVGLRRDPRPAARSQPGRASSDESASDVDYRPSARRGRLDQERDPARVRRTPRTGAQDNYAVAREFLSDSFAQKWNPRAERHDPARASATSRRSGSASSTYTLRRARRSTETASTPRPVRPPRRR